ncbi:hypothetical protein HEBU111660_00635 [Helicobacter burdigaliensis]
MLGILPAYCMDFDSFYRQVAKQAQEKNYITFRHRPLVTKESYHTLSIEEKEQLHQKGGLVLVFSRISLFLFLNEQSGVALSTENGSYLKFDQKYYETLKDIDIGGEIKAMCALPRFNKCILLGYEAF